MGVTMTERAARHIAGFLQKRGKGVGLRLGVRTTGCSGMAYKIEYADAMQPEDQTFEAHGVKILDRPEESRLHRWYRAGFRARRTERGFPLQQPERKEPLRLRRVLQRLAARPQRARPAQRADR